MCLTLSFFRSSSKLCLNDGTTLILHCNFIHVLDLLILTINRIQAAVKNILFKKKADLEYSNMQYGYLIIDNQQDIQNEPSSQPVRFFSAVFLRRVLWRTFGRSRIP